MMRIISLIVLIAFFILLIAMLTLSDNLSDFLRGFSIVMTDNEFTTKELKASLNAIEASIKLTLTSAVIGLFIGTIGILTQIDNPSKIGPAAAIALLTVLYAFIINLFLYGTKAKIKKELIYRG